MGHTFETFLNNAQDRAIDNLTVTHHDNGNYKVQTDDSDDAVSVKKSTIRDWYADCDKKSK